VFNPAKVMKHLSKVSAYERLRTGILPGGTALFIIDSQTSDSDIAKFLCRQISYSKNIKRVEMRIISNPNGIHSFLEAMGITD
jgi:hypothetical protein